MSNDDRILMYFSVTMEYNEEEVRLTCKIFVVL